MLTHHLAHDDARLALPGGVPGLDLRRRELAWAALPDLLGAGRERTGRRLRRGAGPCAGRGRSDWREAAVARDDEYQRIARVMEGFASQINDEAQRERCLALAKAWRELGEAARLGRMSGAASLAVAARASSPRFAC